MILMSINVNCKYIAVNIVNVNVKDGKQVDTKVKWIMLIIWKMILKMFYFKHFVLIDGKSLFTQP